MQLKLPSRWFILDSRPCNFIESNLGIKGLGEEDKIQHRFDVIIQKLSELMFKEMHSLLLAAH